MNIREEKRGNVAVLTLSGRMMGGGETSQFKEQIQRLIDDQFTRIVVDLGRVRWMNSSAIGILTSGLLRIRNAGGDIRLARVGERIISVFVATQLEQVFRSYETVEEAAASFNFEVREEMRGNVAVLVLVGTVTGGGEMKEFRDRLQRLVDGGTVQVVLDLAGVDWMDSTAVEALGAALKTVRDAGGDIRLGRTSRRVGGVLGGTQLERDIRSYETVEAAAASFDAA